MSITVDEFLRLKKICEPRSSDLPVPLTDALINEAAGRLRPYLLSRLEAAKNVSSKEWRTLVIPRRDGLGNITPKGVAQAVDHAYWRLECEVRAIASEKPVEPVTARIMADGTVRCPWCGKLFDLQKEQNRK